MTNNSSPSTRPSVAFTQEIRFAIVMYGGSSLCIYMNGVAQELLRLVRATAPDPDPNNPTQAYLPDESDKLGGSGQVYRELGHLLSRGVNPLKKSDEPSKDDIASKEDKTLRTRFIIDVLSGTSAGGINAVYLAKALANDQDLGELKNLWIKKADIDVLMNDTQSPAKEILAAQKRPHSLLNSRLMYHMLLDALGGMDRQNGSSANGAAKSPYVDELDLYVTATDIIGRKIRMRLADTTAHERRHLNIFHFQYRHGLLEESGKKSGVNHFATRYNPFLAFAARCTSAHPVPFEPVTLEDIDESLEKLNLNVADSDRESWETFYDEYLQPDEENLRPDRESLVKKFQKRPFSDGGVLDNSPFSFAIDSLQYRHSDLPVDRKLLYIEPVPEHPEEELDKLEKPDAFENGWLSLSVLPSYQFIREDLERILERNRLVERIDRILAGIERDEMDRFKDDYKGLKLQRPLDSWGFGEKTIKDMIGAGGRGTAWGGYHRLRVAETTDELTAMVGQAAGFDEKSDEYIAIRYLVRTWRTRNYDAYREGFKGHLHNEDQLREEETPTRKESENRFLYLYDFKWRLRRLKFVMAKINELSCFDERARKILGINNDFSRKEQEENLRRYLIQEYTQENHEDVTPQLLDQFYEDLLRCFVSDSAEQKKFRQSLRSIKKALSKELLKLQAIRDALMSRADKNPLKEDIQKLGITKEKLDQILAPSRDDLRENLAEEELKQNKSKYDEFIGAVDKQLHDEMDKVSKRVREGILRVDADFRDRYTGYGPEQKINFIAQSILIYYYENFDRYDMISYPILYSTNVGEELDTVEVFRISPEDAGHLIKDKEKQRRKLAGATLGHFGAFFDEDFRRNDILWGRLDAAERIITALFSSLPEADLTKQSELIEKAQRAILAEELKEEGKAGLRGLLGAALAKTKTDEDNKAFREKLNSRLTGKDPDLSKLQAFLDVCLRGTDPLHHFRDTSKFKHEIAPKVLIPLAGRASKVFGSLLEGVADQHRIKSDRVVWVTRLAQLFWGTVEVAVPGSIPNLIYSHWLKLLYFFELLLIVASLVLLNPTMQRFGFLMFGLTLASNVAALLLEDVMVSPHKKKNRKTFVFAVGAALLVPLLLLGLVLLLNIFGMEVLRQYVEMAIKPKNFGWNFKTKLSFLLLLLPFVGVFVLVIRFGRNLERQQHKNSSSVRESKQMSFFKTVMKVFRWVAPLAGLMILVLTLPKLLQPTSLPRGFHLPGNLLELVETEAEANVVRAAIGDAAICRNLWIDNFFFIPLYTFLFLVVGWWLTKRDVPFAPLLGVVICIGIVFAAGFDVLENARTFELLKASSPQVVDGIRHAALVKWGTLFALTLVLSFPFLRTGGWLLVVGLLYLITGAVGLSGVIWFRPLVEWGFMLIGLSLLVTGEAVRHIPLRT